MKRNGEWLRELRTGKENIKQNDINLTNEMVKEQVRGHPKMDDIR